MFVVKPIGAMYTLNENSIRISDTIQGEVSQFDNRINVLSEGPYGLNKSDGNLFWEDNLYSKSTHIELVNPIVNVFCAGVNLNIISKLLPKYPVREFAKGSSVLYIKNNEIRILAPSNIDNTLVYNSNTHFIGGFAIRKLLELIDIREEISTLLNKECYTVLSHKQKSQHKKTSLDKHIIGDIVEDIGDVWLVDKYYINLYNPEYISTIKDNADHIRTSLLTGKDLDGIFVPHIAAMLSFRDNANTFYDMIQDIIPVLPLGFRKQRDDSIAPLSQLYNRVIQANSELANFKQTSGCTLNNVRMGYTKLYNAYINLVHTKNTYDNPNYKPLISLLTGKSGVIRNNVLSTTIDYSGRAVITVDPFMSVDTIGIPEGMAVHLCELDAIKGYTSNNKNKYESLSESNRDNLVKRAIEALKGCYVIIGRQPTLYILGMQSFKVKVVEGTSIVLSPIVTAAFNADFDGDQMGVNKPQSKEAIEEAEGLLCNINNIFYPKDGSCHLSPRQEMIYGLYKCYHAKSDESSRTVEYENVATFTSNLVNDLLMQDVLIDDKCKVGNELYTTVGYAALKLFLNVGSLKNVRLGVIPVSMDKSKDESCITESFYKEVFKYVKLNFKTDSFVALVNRVVQLGFTVSNLYALDVNILQTIDTSKLKDEFELSGKDEEEYHCLGLVIDNYYSSCYNERYGELAKSILFKVKEELGMDNGFMQLVASGARGSSSNLLQLFGMKGLVVKNKSEVFNAIIKTPLCNQLTGLEHFITAYGSREGIIDKVIGTHEPGYLSRLISHVCRHLVITTDDCGTSNGILLNYNFLCNMYGKSKLTGESIVDLAFIRKYAIGILETRFIVGNHPTPLTAVEAGEIFDKRIAYLEENNIVIGEGVKLRSPITCESQCCVKCYGTDLVTNRIVVQGTPIGFVSGTTIGEPGTQLIMQNFKSGGTAGNKNLTSSFDVLTTLVQMYSVSKLDNKSEIITHDYISPVEGKIKLKSISTGVSQLQIINNDSNVLRETVHVYDKIKLKEYVKVGESIQIVEGILDVNEILKYRGVEEAQMFVLFSAYNLFLTEAFVNFKYFEILVNGMTLHLCSRGNSYFKTGLYYSIQEFYSNNREGAEFITVMKGVKQVPKVRSDFLTSLYLEDVNKIVSRHLAIAGTDQLKDPLVRVSLGLKPNLGTAYSDYITERGR